MPEESEGGRNYFALGAITGAALGVALALLLAPQPGKQTRAVLREKGIELQQRARKVTPGATEPQAEPAGDDDVTAGEAPEET